MGSKKPEASRRSDRSPSPLPIEGAPAQTPLPIEGVPAQDGADASKRSGRSPSTHQSSSSDSSESSGLYHYPRPVPCDRESRHRESDNEYDPTEEVFS